MIGVVMASKDVRQVRKQTKRLRRQERKTRQRLRNIASLTDHTSVGSVQRPVKVQLIDLTNGNVAELTYSSDLGTSIVSKKSN